MNVNQFIISILGVKIKPYLVKTFCLEMNFFIYMPIKKILVSKNFAINMKQLKLYTLVLQNIFVTYQQVRKVTWNVNIILKGDIRP